MSIGFFNCDRNLTNLFNNPFILDGKSFPEIGGLVINWTTKNLKLEYAKQASILDRYLKKDIPSVIFDNSNSITFKEYKWLRRYNTNLFEPNLLHRDGFKYLPFWVYNLYDMDEYEKDKKFHDVSFKGYLKNKISSFEKYYIDTAINYPNYKVVYDSELTEIKSQDFKNNNVNKVKNLNLKESKFSIIIGSPRDYKTGKLDSLFADSINNGCVPIIVPENRFYGNFNTTIKDIRIIEIFLSCTVDTSYGIIMGIHDEISRNYPEMKVNYIVDIINNILEKG